MTTITPTTTDPGVPGGPSGPGGPAGSGGPGSPERKGPVTARRPRSRRWLRLVVPPAVVIALMLIGIGVYEAEQPSATDAAYLSPDSHAGIGSSDLADRVRAAGVSVIPERHSSDALVAAYAGNVTLLITTPQLMHSYYLRMLKLLPATTRVVIVEPGTAAVHDGLLPFDALHRNYAAKVAAPGCDYAPAAQAGQAGVERTRYGPVDPSLGGEVARCYDDSLVVYKRESTTVTVVGSADPFRNDRIGEHGNARLATALLTGAPRLVWLDLHERETPPLVNNDPGLAGGPAAPPSLRPQQSGDPLDRDFPVDGNSRGPRPPIVTPSGGGGGGGGGAQAADPPNPIWVAFPKWVYPTTALLVIGVIALAVARARRLGAPVVEPLPVVVRSSETALGRGRLYQRARARPEALQVLRDAALARLIRLLRLEPDIDRHVLVEAVAARSGWPAATVGDVLYGPAPADDAGLVAAAATLEHLVNATAAEQHGTTGPAGPTEQHGTTGPAGPTEQPGTTGPADPTEQHGTTGPAGPTEQPGPTGRNGATGQPGGEHQHHGATGRNGPIGQPGGEQQHHGTTGQDGAEGAPGGTVEGEPR